MKRGTIQHPKVGKLAELLDLPLLHAVGLLEALWHFTAKYAQRGDVGRFDDEQISRGLSWEGEDPSLLIDKLVEAGWLDRCDEHRLVVHDWADHADDTTKRALKRNDRTFVRTPSDNVRSVADPCPDSGRQNPACLKPEPKTKPCRRLAKQPPASAAGSGAVAALRGAGVSGTKIESITRDHPNLTALMVLQLQGDPPCNPGLLVRKIEDGDRPPPLALSDVLALAKRGDITAIGEIRLETESRLTRNDNGIYADGELAVTPDMLKSCQIQTRYDDQ